MTTLTITFMKVSCLAVSFLGSYSSVSTNRYVNWGGAPKHFPFLSRLYHILSVQRQLPSSISSQWPTGDFLLPGPTTVDPAGLGVLFPTGSTLLPRAQQESHWIISQAFWLLHIGFLVSGGQQGRRGVTPSQGYWPRSFRGRRTAAVQCVWDCIATLVSLVTGKG